MDTSIMLLLEIKEWTSPAKNQKTILGLFQTQCLERKEWTAFLSPDHKLKWKKNLKNF
jgi:hypothetical protein